MRTNDIAAKWILDPSSFSVDDIKKAEQNRMGTAWQEPCIVSIYQHGKLIAVGDGVQQIMTEDLTNDPPTKKLIDLTIAEAVDMRLISYVNKTVTRNQLTDILIKEIT